MISSLPSKARNVGLIPVRRTRIPYATGQRSLYAATAGPATARVKPVCLKERQ